MRKALIVSSADLEALLGRTVLWRNDVQRTLVADPEAAFEAAGRVRPNLVVVGGTNGHDQPSFIRRLRVDPDTRSTAIVALLSSAAVLDDQPLREAGANLVLSDQVDPAPFDARLWELLNVPRRREARIPVRVQHWSGVLAEPERGDGLALNISVHGLLLESTGRLGIGTNLDLQFQLPGRDEDLHAVGQVVRQEAVSRSGIKFVVLRGDAREQIRAFVESDRRQRVSEGGGTTPREASERDEWAAELHESETRKAAVLEAALDAIVTIDQEGRILDFNSAAATTFGYSRDEAMGRRMADLIIPARLRKQHQRGLARYLATGEGPVLGRRIETVGLRADGSEFPVELAITPIQLRGNRLFTGYLRDISERKRAEEAALAREEHFRALVENSADAIGLLSEDGRTRYLTPSATRVLGYSAEEAHALPLFDLVHPDDAGHARSQFQKSLDSPGVLISIELRARHKDGRWRWLEVDVVNRLDEPPVRAVVANYRDISERKLAEELLWENATHLKEIITATPIVLWAVDRDGVFTLSEGRGLSALGLKPGQLVGRSLFDVYADNARVCDLVRRALAGEELSALVEVGAASFDAHYAPMRAPGGEIVGATGVAVDISERRQAEKAVEEQRDFLRRVLDISPSFIFAKDREGRFTLVNQAVADAYGTTVEGLLGKTDADFNPNPEQVAWFRRHDLEVMDLRREKLIPEEEITDASGRRRWLQTVKRPMFGPEGVAHQVLGFAADISARKRAEAVQSALYRIAKASNSAVDMDALYAEIHAIVGELMFAKNFYIAVYDESAELLTFPYFVDEGDPTPMPKKLGKGLTEYVLRTGKPLLASPEAFAELQRTGEVELIGAPSLDWIGVPLMAHDRTLGVLVVQSYSEAVRYGEEELAVLTFVSQQIAEAIELKRAEAARVEVLAQAQAARLEAEALRDASLALAKDLGLDSVLECLLDCLRRLVPYDSANVMLLEGGSRLAIRAVRGYEAWTDPEAVKAVEFDAKRNPVLRELVSTRRPVLIADTTTHPGWEDKRETSYIRSWMGVPLVAGDRLIGLYSLDKALPAFFGAEHVRLAEGLAGSAARAVRNAQLYEELRRRATGRQATKRTRAKKS